MNRTPHDVAVAYMRKGWLPFKNRSEWEDSLQYKGVMRLPKEKSKKTLAPLNQPCEDTGTAKVQL